MTSVQSNNILLSILFDHNVVSFNILSMVSC